MARHTIDELLAEADIVSLHVPLTEETHNLIDARRLALMRDGACLVNTARGAIVDLPNVMGVTPLMGAAGVGVSGRGGGGLDTGRPLRAAA